VGVRRLDFDTLGLMRLCADCFHAVDECVQRVLEVHKFATDSVPNAYIGRPLRRVARFAKPQSAQHSPGAGSAPGPEKPGVGI
jgi:hypothetical protein